MKYKCVINQIDDEEITIDINGNEIVCFCNSGCNYNIGDSATCELTLYDDLTIEETNKSEGIQRLNSSYSYKIVGVLDVDNQMIKSCIDFALDDEDIWDVAYLDSKMVEVEVTRIDIMFCGLKNVK